MAYGIAFNSLSGASVALDVSVAVELGIGVSIAMAIPNAHWYDYVEFWHWDLGGVSITLSEAAEKAQVAVGVGWTTVITVSELVAKGGSYAPSFTLTSGLDSNKCLDVSGGQTANDTNIDLYDCNGTNSQKWFWNGNTLRSGLDHNKCLDVWQGGTNNDTNIDLYDCNNTNSQNWTCNPENGASCNP